MCSVGPPRKIPLCVLCTCLTVGLVILLRTNSFTDPNWAHVTWIRNPAYCAHWLIQQARELQADARQHTPWLRYSSMVRKLRAIANLSDRNGLRRQTCRDLCIMLSKQGGSQSTNYVAGWAPNEGQLCQSRSSDGTIIIIPVLKSSLHAVQNLASILTGILRTANICHRIFAVEQHAASAIATNAGMLMNIGFVEAGMRFTTDCVVFHDPHLRPDNATDRMKLLSFRCDDPQTRQGPVHMAVYVNQTITSARSLSGVLRIRPEHFIRSNGFSNWFWNLTGVSDDFERRIRLSDLVYSQENLDVGRYISTATETGTAESRQNALAWTLIDHAGNRMSVDGLRQLHYELLTVVEHANFTRLVVRLPRDHICFPNTT